MNVTIVCVFRVVRAIAAKIHKRRSGLFTRVAAPTLGSCPIFRNTLAHQQMTRKRPPCGAG
jgi:hypothetical protein